MSEIKETIERVRRLAKYATPGPWRVGETEACPEGDADMVYAADGPLCGPFAREADAALISAYRADALALADEVERMKALVDVPYRPGLPSVEQVRAHEARSGRWQVLDPKGNHPSEAWMEALSALDETVVLRAARDVALEMTAWSERSSYRPCLPDGTPCPWPV